MEMGIFDRDDVVAVHIQVVDSTSLMELPILGDLGEHLEILRLVVVVVVLDTIK